jgi:hypothetical protein
MSKEHSRREVLSGAAAVVATSAMPVLPEVAAAPPMLWPQDTQLQRAATIVRTMIEFIVKLEGKGAESVTVEDIHFRTQYFGMNLEETSEAFAECLLAVERYAYHPWPPRGRGRIVRGGQGEYRLVEVADWTD